ncbi:molecular chaperone IbpA [Luteibacter sp. UNC138MFCol5.1]|uniref:Hsp20 family protein n=1 Tax=Luteibacter sp. UNC138MFCol5.1 TaxID=1502774 RepID=UPI0008C84329|nr:Hsp20 family protein [Luteibacter sp. UNC138MFCol5.1]SEO67445.1 molecular chaperone IbpA [Luteibacter sp. UNC138MFCol5.1]
MRTLLDFTPLHRSSIGFDRVFDLLESAARTQQGDNYPPFDSVKLSDDAYRITMAVAGFTEDELSISAQGNLLLVSGEHKTDPEGEFLHRGIANRAFSRRFELAEHIYVTGARLANGLLSIELKREVPEAMKPRRIAIDSAGASTSTVKQLHSEAA